MQQGFAKTGAGASARTPAEAAANADIVVIAVPWDAVEAVVRSLGNLSGKIVLDPTNPRIVGDDGLRDWAVDSSNAEIIQALAPGARVVKALGHVAKSSSAVPNAGGGRG